MYQYEVWVTVLPSATCCFNVTKKIEISYQWWKLNTIGQREIQLGIRFWFNRENDSIFDTKAGLYLKKVLSSIFVGLKSALWELFPTNQTTNSKKYCSELDELKAKMARKRTELVNRWGLPQWQSQQTTNVSERRHKTFGEMKDRSTFLLYQPDILRLREPVK